VAALTQEMFATRTLATSIRPVERGVNHTGLKKRRLTALALVFVLTGLAGCTSAALPPEPVIETADDLLAALEQAGHPLEPTALGAAVDGLVGGRVYILDGAYLDVFEYETVQTQKAAEQGLVTGVSDVAWGRGKILVVYRGTDGGSIALLSGLLGDPLTLSDEVIDEPYPPAVAAAIAFLGEDLGEDPGRIGVVEYESAEWPDACLGLGGPSETCAEVVTAGWRIVLQLDATTYVLRSDTYGQVVRRE
jgi:hypothetical protein